MTEILLVVQAIVAVLLVVVILMQNKGEGLGSIAGDFSGSYHTKRGFEKFLVRSSVLLSVLFLGIALFTVTIGV
ncbi:MAG: preprotein translocase subunit SecG [Candidatus Moraniibacteriota bacterium]|nr:MAG: preprotein translocase subunit SecG [Candidatus Moranbacteria bacterium]